MGRLFLVEFDDFDSGKFYVCGICRTPLARNTDVFHYWKRPGDLLDEIVIFSVLKKVSNVVDSGVIHEASNAQEEYDWQNFHCVSCNNLVGIKYMDRESQEPFAFCALPSSRVLFRMSGNEHEASLFSPNEWFDPPRPPGERIQ